MKGAFLFYLFHMNCYKIKNGTKQKKGCHAEVPEVRCVKAFAHHASSASA